MDKYSYFDSLSENKKLQIVLNCAVPYFANSYNNWDGVKFVGFIAEQILKLKLEEEALKNGN